mgnify:CR=1 FL=1
MDSDESRFFREKPTKKFSSFILSRREGGIGLTTTRGEPLPQRSHCRRYRLSRGLPAVSGIPLAPDPLQKDLQTSCKYHRDQVCQRALAIQHWYASRVIPIVIGMVTLKNPTDGPEPGPEEPCSLATPLYRHAEAKTSLRCTSLL